MTIDDAVIAAVRACSERGGPIGLRGVVAEVRKILPGTRERSVVSALVHGRRRRILQFTRLGGWSVIGETRRALDLTRRRVLREAREKKIEIEDRRTHAPAPRREPLVFGKHYVIRHNYGIGYLYLFGGLGVALDPRGKLIRVGLAVAGEGLRRNEVSVQVA